jgi:hypothetical protein
MTTWRRIARLLAVLAVAISAPPTLAAQLHGQRWDVTPEAGRATVGDPVTLVFRVRLDERDLLFDTVPKPAGTTPDWVRILSVEKLRRQPDRIYTGRARVAFYRPGRQAVPVFELPFMRSVKGLSRGTLSSDSASVEIVPLVTDPSSATLRDIKEPMQASGPSPLELLLGLGALAAAGWVAWRGRRRAPTPAPASPPIAAVPPPEPLQPYQIALERLAAIETQRWGAQDVARHYEAVADALRDYLEAAEALPARERTTAELLWSLPPRLSAGLLRRQHESLFDEADLVKFARRRPDAAAAAAFLGRARTLLAGWREAAAGETADALR